MMNVTMSNLIWSTFRQLKMFMPTNSATPTVGLSDPSSTVNMAGAAGGQRSDQSANVDRNQLYEWILQLSNSKTREAALLELRLIWDKMSVPLTW